MEFFAAFGLICFLPILIVGSVLWRAFVGTKLWLWFVVPQFGLAPLPIIIAIGLSSLIGLYSSPVTPPKDPEATNAQKFAESIIRVALYPALALLGGWIAHQFQ